MSIDHSTSPSPSPPPQPLTKKSKGKAKSKPRFTSRAISMDSDDEVEPIAPQKPAPKAKAPPKLTDSTKGPSFVGDLRCDYCKRKNNSPCSYRQDKSQEMLKWACKACLGTQQPLERQPNFTACIKCLKDHQSNCFEPKALKYLGSGFMATDLYHPQYPMAKSLFPTNCFGQNLDGDLLTKANGFHLDLKDLQANALLRSKLKKFKSDSKQIVMGDSTVKAPSKKSKTIKSDDVVVVIPRKTLRTVTSPTQLHTPSINTLMKMSTSMIWLTNQNAALQHRLKAIEGQLEEHDALFAALSFHNDGPKFIEGSSRSSIIPSVVVDNYEEDLEEVKEDQEEDEEA